MEDDIIREYKNTENNEMDQIFIKEINLGSIWDDRLANKNSSRRKLGFNTKFLTLKSHLGVSLAERKFHLDSLLKKCKSKFFKNVHQAMKKCLKINVERLPQNFITNIKIEYNKLYIEKKILEIYVEYKILPNLEYLCKNNLIRENKRTYFLEFINLTFREIYELYITSQQYMKDYENLKEKENDNFAVLFNFTSRVFIQYYTFSKGNTQRNLNPNKKMIKLKFKKGGGIRFVTLQKKIIFKISKDENDDISENIYNNMNVGVVGNESDKIEDNLTDL